MPQFLSPEACVFRGTGHDETQPLRDRISSLSFAASLKLPFDSSTPNFLWVMHFTLKRQLAWKVVPLIPSVPNESSPNNCCPAADKLFPSTSLRAQSQHPKTTDMRSATWWQQNEDNKYHEIVGHQTHAPAQSTAFTTESLQWCVQRWLCMGPFFRSTVVKVLIS